MIRLSWHAGEILKTTLLASVVLGVVLAGETWPTLRLTFWGAFLAAVAAYIYWQERKPVNYRSIAVSRGTIEYVTAVDRHRIELDKVVKISFLREQALFDDLYGPYLETKWLLQSEEGRIVEVMDEWPHRRLLLRTFARHLSGFDMARAKEGIRSREKGRWVCYERSASAA